MELKDDLLIDELQRVGKVGFFTYDIKKNKIIHSGVISELFGISRDYVKDRESWINIVHPSQRAEVRAYFIEIIKTGKYFDKEYRIVYKNDEAERWVEVKGKVFFDEKGEPEKLSGTIHDISELKKSEERYKRLYMEFQEKESLLVSLINSIPDLIYYKDINGAYLGCNKAFENFARMKKEEIIGFTDFDIACKDPSEFFRKVDLKEIKQKEPIIYDEWYKCRDGQSLLFNTLKTPYYDSNGNILGLIGISRDITEIKTKEELQRKIEDEKKRSSRLKETDRIKTEFFTNISHELRTPINVIFSALQMEEFALKSYTIDNPLTDKFKYIKMMKQNCYRLLRLINNLIDITKFENGYFNINLINHDIISIIEDVTLSVADYIENKDISIIFDTNVEEKIIACDSEKIERIVLNLLSNSVKFTPCGGKINVEIEDRINYISIKVKDTGKGIPADKLNSIFERFVQVDRSFTRDNEGSGIGLSIVKSLVEQHGGQICVKSIEGEGTEFIIHMPCKVIKNEESINNSSSAKMNKNSFEKINIEFSDIYN
jgi:PAS domain S-box-containing protein